MMLLRRVLIVALVAGFVGAMAPASVSAATSCGSVTTARGVWRIQTARHVSCRYAKALVKRIQAGRGQPAGWRCQGGGRNPLLNCGAPGKRLVSARRAPGARSQTCAVGAYGNGTPLKAKYVSCKTAIRVAEASWARAASCIKGCTARGFRCHGAPNSVEGGEMICRRGNARVRFDYGG